MLDDIEASSSRIYSQTRAMKSEASRQNESLGNITSLMEDSTRKLTEEANYVARVRKTANAGVCWMYGIIAAEATMLVFLLYSAI